MSKISVDETKYEHIMKPEIMTVNYNYKCQSIL
jgi:hypothetical protein